MYTTVVDKIIRFFSNKTGINIKYYLKNSAWVSIRQFVTIVTGISLSVVFARLAEQEIYGQYQFILSLLSLVSIISLPGVNASLIQATARGFEGSYVDAFKKKLQWSFVGIPIMLILGIYYYPESQILGISLMICAVLFPLIYPTNIWESFLQGKERFDKTAKYFSIQAIISTIAMIWAVTFLRNNLVLFVLTFLSTQIIFNAIWYLYSKKLISVVNRDNKVIDYGLFLTKIRIPGIVASNLDKIFIGIFIGPVDLAVYAIGVNLARRFFSLVKNFAVIASPKIAQSNTLSFKRYLSIFVLFSVLGIILYFIMPDLIVWLFSKKYESSIHLSRLVVLFLPFSILNQLYKTHFLYYVRSKSLLLKESIIFPVVRIVILIPLALFFGVQGLAFLAGFQALLNSVVLFLISKISKLKGPTSRGV